MAVTSIDLLNQIRANASETYQERIPEATKENLTAVGELLTSAGYEAIYNEWLGAIGKIALTIFTNRSYQNPLKVLKKGKLGLGETLEEIFVAIAKGQVFDPEATDGFVRKLPDAVTFYHSKTFDQTYSVSVSRRQVLGAFQSEGTLDRFFTECINSLYSGYEYDEYLTLRELILQEAKNGYVIASPDPTTAEGGKAFVKSLREQVMQLGFMHSDRNPLGVLTHTPREDLVLFVSPDVYSSISVEVLASAFNRADVDWETRIIVLDDFSSLKLGDDDKPFAILMDANSIQVRDRDISMLTQPNAANASIKYYLHVLELMAVSHVGNIITWFGSHSTTTAVHTGGITAKWSDGKNYLLTDEDGYKPYYPWGVTAQTLTLKVHGTDIPSSATVVANAVGGSSITGAYSDGEITLSGELEIGDNIELDITVS